MHLTASAFEKLWQAGREAVLDGVRLRVPKPLHLVALKLHALKQNPARMGKDWEDIKHLLDMTPREWSDVELSEVAHRYASEHLRAELRHGGYL